MNLLLWIKAIELIFKYFNCTDLRVLDLAKATTEIFNDFKKLNKDNKDEKRRAIETLIQLLHSFEKDLNPDTIKAVNNNVIESLKNIDEKQLVKCVDESYQKSLIDEVYKKDGYDDELNDGTCRALKIIISYLLENNNLVAFKISASFLEGESYKTSVETNQIVKQMQGSIENFTKQPDFKRDATYDEKLHNFDLTINNNHFKALSTDINIEDIFILGNFEISKVFELDLMEEDEHSDIIDIDSIIHIITEQKMFLIEGAYGTGKTILSLKLQLELNKQGYNTFFCNSTDLIAIEKKYMSIDNYFSKYMNNNKIDQLFLFIDSFDILNFKNTDVNENALKDWIEKIKDLANNNQINIIVNSRCFDYEGVDIFITFAFAYNCFDSTFKFIRTSKFRKKQIDEFYKKFENVFFSKINGSFLPLNRTMLEEWYKRISESCQNPLFAFVLAHYYYTNKKLPELPLDIYDDFIKRTIEGKYKNEQQSIAHISKDFKNEYGNFLSELAKKLVLIQKEVIEYKDDYNNISNWTILCEQKMAFSVPDEELLEGISDELRNFFSKYSKVGNILNCFFFRIYESDNEKRMVCFSDDNFMCCLAVKRVLYLFDTIIRNDDDHTRKMLFKELGLVSLRPMVVDFLITKIMKYEKERKDTLINIFHQMMRDNEKEKSYSSEMIQAQIIMHILYMKFYKSSYKENNNNHFFKRFSLMCKVAKAMELTGEHVNGSHRFISERYFANCSFIGCDYKRLNLKYYNFNGSYLKDSRFEQCRFDYTDSFACKLNKVDFIMCSVKYTDLKLNLQGKIKFDKSLIDRLSIKEVIIPSDPNVQIEIEFYSCMIKNLEIKGCSSNRIIFMFRDCIIEQLKLYDCKCQLIVKNCVIHSTIKNNGSELIILEDNNLNVTSSNKFYKADNKSDTTLLPKE